MINESMFKVSPEVTKDPPTVRYTHNDIIQILKLKEDAIIGYPRYKLIQVQHMLPNKRFRSAKKDEGTDQIQNYLNPFLSKYPPQPTTTTQTVPEARDKVWEETIWSWIGILSTYYL